MATQMLHVHRCRFVELTPSTVVALSFKSDGSLLAVGRENGDIELWDAKNGYVCQSRIPGNGDSSIQALLWVGDRLFSAGFNAHIIEWDLNRLVPLRSSPSYGGAIWSATASHSGAHLALGCEDGSVRIFRLNEHSQHVVEPALVYDRALPRQAARVLSVAWSFDDALLACGDSAGCVRLFSIEFARPLASSGVLPPLLLRNASHLLRITVGSLAAEPALVWALAFLPDGQLVSGDSLGRTQFWDTRFGTLLQGYRQHEADVLALAVDAQRGMLYASGIDNKLVQFRCAPATAAPSASSAEDAELVLHKWIPVASSRAHSHDVRALAVVPPSASSTASTSSSSSPSSSSSIAATAANSLAALLSEEELLVSGGVDTQLCVYRAWAFSAAHQTRHPVSDRPRVLKLAPQHNGGLSSPLSLAPHARLLLLQRPRALQVWRLGAGVPVEAPPSDEADEASESNSSSSSSSSSSSASSSSGVRVPPPNLSLTRGASLLAELRLREGGLHLTAAAISPDGRFVACSDPAEVRLFQLQHTYDEAEEEQEEMSDSQSKQRSPSAVSVHRLPVHGVLSPAASLVFSADSSRLIAGCVDGCVRVVSLPDANVSEQDAGSALQVVHTFTQHLHAPTAASIDVSVADDASSNKSSKKSKTSASASASSSLSSSSAASAPTSSASSFASSSSSSVVIRSLSVSSDGQWLASGDTRDRMHVFHLPTLQFQASLPNLPSLFLMVASSSSSFASAASDKSEKSIKLSSSSSSSSVAGHVAPSLFPSTCTHTSLAFHPQQPWLAVATSSNHFFLFDVAARRLVDFTKQCLPRYPTHLLSQEDRVRQLVFNPGKPNSLLLVARSFLCHVDLDKPLPADSTGLRKRKAKDISKSAQPVAPSSSHPPVSGYARGDNFRIIERYRPMVFADFAGADELVLVECPWLKTVQQLPDPMYRGVYGRK